MLRRLARRTRLPVEQVLLIPRCQSQILQERIPECPVVNLEILESPEKYSRQPQALDPPVVLTTHWIRLEIRSRLKLRNTNTPDMSARLQLGWLTLHKTDT